nr:immunoglobulin light chain junction region [Macaca mulatta]MOV73036.1 immunoglobulin light chain junction region [Macaca mulatta]MOX16978.1 immunoglobulin light chain junction region [Macaca mulatta]MOX17114.1 immunoglobulin light chain junction region [Macaca mulatta]MOX17134.1 immunoglobulin light chain junction region [Macaca mulatta]
DYYCYSTDNSGNHIF